MTVHLEFRERVAIVTLDRPERRNAVDHATLLALRAAQHDVADSDARCMVLTGAPPAFCAGADLTGVESGAFTDALLAALHGFSALPLPVIAAIDGPALGAGTQLAIACDLRVATPTSVFGIPAAKLGLVVDQWTIQRLAAEFGSSVARGMLVAAQPYTAAQLVVSGGVHRTGGLAEALEWAEQLVCLAPLTMAAHKLGLQRFAHAVPVADDVFEAARAAAWASDDAEEGRQAFLAKRPAQFHGR